MAVPTNVRVWAIASTATFLKWTPSGTNDQAIYRSTDGASYSVVKSVSGATTTYEDIALSTGTKYYYKISNDDGATFSTVVTVKTHVCGASAVIRKKGFVLPRFRQKQLEKGNLRAHNRAMRDLEDLIEKRVLPQEPCVACITDGAIVIDCSQDCDCYDVEVDGDINSISFVNCDGIDPCINFRVPPSASRGICGWPQGHDSLFQFSGDECIQAPISGGTNGRTVSTGKNKPPQSKPGSGKGGGSGGGSSCECVAGTQGQLTVKCCTSDCSMSCGSSKSLDIMICGGTEPYSITGSAGLTFAKKGGSVASTGITKGQRITISPPANSGSAVVGKAYSIYTYVCVSCGGGSSCTSLTTLSTKEFNCDDSVNGCAGSLCSPTPPSASDGTCTIAGAAPCLPECTTACPGPPYPGNATSRTCDSRTAPMIAANCNPCGVSTLSKTFTVTDAQGVSVVTSIQA